MGKRLSQKRISLSLTQAELAERAGIAKKTIERIENGGAVQVVSIIHEGLWTGTHQMSINGKRDNFTFDDFNTVGKVAGLKRGSAKRILSEIIEVVKQWQFFAENAGVYEQQIIAIANTHRLLF